MSADQRFSDAEVMLGGMSRPSADNNVGLNWPDDMLGPGPLTVRMAGNFDDALRSFEECVPSRPVERYFEHDTASESGASDNQGNSSDTWGFLVLWRHDLAEPSPDGRRTRRTSLLLASSARETGTATLDGSHRAFAPLRGIIWEAKNSVVYLAIDDPSAPVPEYGTGKFAGEDAMARIRLIRLMEHLAADDVAP